MGSLCSSEQEINQAELIKSQTFELDKEENLLDQLVVEKYKAACRIQSRAKGFLTRKKLKLLIDAKKQLKK